MPCHGSFSAAVIVNGCALPEYDPPSDELHNVEPRTEVRYIEVQEGTSFTVQYAIRPHALWSTGSKACECYIDGRRVGGAAAGQHHCELLGGITYAFTGVSYKQGPNYVQRDFMFRNLATTEEEQSFEDLKQLAKDLGTIQIKISDFVRKGQSHIQNQPIHLERPVPEKALKGQPIHISSGLGIAKPATALTQVTGELIPGTTTTFIFKYRSRAALQMLEIIPSTPELLTNFLADDSRPRHNIPVKEERVEGEERDTPLSQTAGKRPAEHDEDEDCQIVEVKKCRRDIINKGEPKVEILDLE